MMVDHIADHPVALLLASVQEVKAVLLLAAIVELKVDLKAVPLLDQRVVPSLVAPAASHQAALLLDLNQAPAKVVSLLLVLI
jgi:hypothetical protein